MSGYNRALGRIFTKNVIEELASFGKSEIYRFVVDYYIPDAITMTNGEVIQELYSVLAKEYRNEYYYTNTLLNKLLAGIHNVNTTTALTQFRVADHVADFVLINGEAQVFEIKSDLDNLERLSGQIKDYYKAFRKVSVLASEHEAPKIESILDSLGEMGNAVGVYVLTDRNTIFGKKTGREPCDFTDSLNHYSMIAALRKKEYQEIILQEYGYLPDVAPVFQFRECYQLFKQIPILDAHKMMAEQLKRRKHVEKAVFESVPQELKGVVYFSSFSLIPEILRFYEEPYVRR